MQSIISQAATWLIFISIASQSFQGIDFSSFNEKKIDGQNGNLKVMMLGDSITAGYPSTGGFRPFLWNLFCEKKIKVDFVGSRSGGPPELPDKDHEGHGGWTALQLAEGVKGWVDEYKPDIVLLMAGTNDMCRNTDPLKCSKDIELIVDNIHEVSKNTSIFVSSIPPIGYGQETVNSINKTNDLINSFVQIKIHNGWSVYYVNMKDAVGVGDLYKDGVHIDPLKSANNRIAKKWFEAIITDLQG